jgi:site-specific DNA-methyltransferase (adenine-specific)
MKTNVLYYGDNLDILRNREYFPDECADLIYLDPPFNSKKDCNILFKENGGVESEAQIKAFTDSWHWWASWWHSGSSPCGGSGPPRCKC